MDWIGWMGLMSDANEEAPTVITLNIEVYDRTQIPNIQYIS